MYGNVYNLNVAERNIHLRQVLNVCLDTRSNSDEISLISVNYAAVIPGDRETFTLKKAYVTFTGSTLQCEKIQNSIELFLKNAEWQHPKKALLFINPVAGHHSGPKLYEKVVKPVFDLCKVQCDAFVTKDAEEPVRVLQNYDLSTVDVIISMGGDGSFKQIVKALIQRVASDRGIDLNNPECEIDNVGIPVCALPAGSANVTSMVTHSTWIDIETAAINVVLGCRIPADFVTIRNGGKYLTVDIGFVCLGEFCNVMWYMERIRFLCPLRYQAIEWIRKITFRQNYAVVEYKTIPEEKREVTWNESNIDISASNVETSNESLLTGWKTFRGKISDVMLWHWSFLGTVPYVLDYLYSWSYRKPVMSHGKWMLYIEKAKNSKETQFMWGKETLEERSQMPLSLCEPTEITECRIKSTGKWAGGNFMINSGDELKLPAGVDLHCKLHTKVVDVVAIDDVIITYYRQTHKP